MPTKRSKSRRRIDVIDGEVLTAVEQLWAQTRASFARAQRATRCMQLTARIPEPSTRLVN
jgi:hypothetical protein